MLGETLAKRTKRRLTAAEQPVAAASDDRAAQGLSRRRQLSVVAGRLVEQLERQPLLRLGEQL